MQKTILEQHKHHQAVKIPDLFESFRSIPPKINPLYAQVNEASLSWLAQWVFQTIIYADLDLTIQGSADLTRLLRSVFAKQILPT